MKKIEDIYYFQRKDNMYVIGIIYTGNGTWEGKSFHVFDCSTPEIRMERVELSNNDYRILTCPEEGEDQMGWIPISKEKINPIDRQNIRMFLEKNDKNLLDLIDGKNQE